MHIKDLSFNRSIKYKRDKRLINSSNIRQPILEHSNSTLFNKWSKHNKTDTENSGIEDFIIADKSNQNKSFINIKSH